MPGGGAISQYAAVYCSTVHTDGTPGFQAASGAIPAIGIALQAGAAGDTVDVAAQGAIVTNPSWNFTGNYAYVRASGVVGDYPSPGALQIIGKVLNSTTIIVEPNFPIQSSGGLQSYPIPAVYSTDSPFPTFLDAVSSGANVNLKQVLGIGTQTGQNQATPGANGELCIVATSNTLLTFKYQGSDGVIRTGTLTLA